MRPHRRLVKTLDSFPLLRHRTIVFRRIELFDEMSEEGYRNFIEAMRERIDDPDYNIEANLSCRAPCRGPGPGMRRSKARSD